MPLVIAILVAMGLIAIPLLDMQHTEQVVAFHKRCTNQGGTVLRSYKPDGNGWIGCYKGLTEIPNG